MLDKNQPIIVKKIKKGDHGHHGGAWKIAYADFVTAMMAFFLLMWLLAITTEEQKRAIADYFMNPTAVTGGPKGSNSAIIDMGSHVRLDPGAFGKRQEPSPSRDQGDANSSVPTDSEVMRRMEEIEQKSLNDLKSEIEKAISKSPSLKAFRDQLLLEMTKDGLRITVTDKQNRPMFDLGSAYLKWYMRDILKEIAKLVNEVPNRISIAGHTDAKKFYSDAGYSNWELSADRANASRRTLLEGGMKQDKVIRVVGLASVALYDKEEPYNPINRRITITVLKKKAEEAIARAAEAVDYREAGGLLKGNSETPTKKPPAQTKTPAAEPVPQYPAAPSFINLPNITPDMVETPLSE